MKCDELTAIKVILNNHGKPMASIQGTTRYYGISPYNTFYPQDEVDEAIAELKAKLEDVQATAYAESVDAGMRERKLKRALWLARAEIAHKKIDEYWPDYCHNAHSRIALLKWEEVERKCRAKAESYL